MVAEEQVLLWLTTGIEPTHRVRAHLLGRLVELDGVAPGLVHLATVLGKERRIAKQVLEGRFLGQHCALRQQTVEPVSILAGEAL